MATDNSSVAPGPVHAEQPGQAEGISRRRMIGYLIAGPTLIAAAGWRAAPAAAAPIKTVQLYDSFDLSDVLNAVGAATANLIRVTINGDGTASFDMPRAEVGQGITTACAMIVADELDLPVDRVKVTLADAKSELRGSQFTGGSNTIHSLYDPLRLACATARQRMAEVAAKELRASEADLRFRDGVIAASNGRSTTYGELAERAAVAETSALRARPKARAAQNVIGTSVRRTDARAAVTGRKTFAMDLDIPDALPTMICRPPTINGSAQGVSNAAEVRRMPGVTDIAVIPRAGAVQGGVAVRAETFGQCIDAIRRLRVDWKGGPTVGKTDDSVQADLRDAEIPLTPGVPGTTIDRSFEFMFRPGDPLETNCAVADVRADRAEIWASTKSPIYAKDEIARIINKPSGNVTLHVVEGGGSFGRHLFIDNAAEAAVTSAAMGKPVKLMWHRTDNFRHGRVHPAARSRVRVVHDGSTVLTYDQRHTSVQTDFTQGFGEILTAAASALPAQNFLQYSQSVFALTANVPYNFGVVTQLLNEIYEFDTFNTSSVRNIYSPNVATATELVVDEIAKGMGKDPLAFRLEFAKDDRSRAVLRKAAEVGRWGRSMAPGTAQGIVVRDEYKGRCAVLLEIDTTAKQTNRRIPDVEHYFTGPRVTKAVCAVDVGVPINPLGLKAQMMGAMMDGIAQALTYSLHHDPKGHFLEGSWDDAYYTRQWNTPPELEVIVMPATTKDPGGAGELACGTAMAAAATAYARATGTVPTRFPINHNRSNLGFEVFPTTPPIPESPTDGLKGLRPKRRRKRRARRRRRPATRR